MVEPTLGQARAGEEARSREGGRAAKQDSGTGVIGRSAAMRRALWLARRAAPTELPVLLVGTTGTGKELLAREIHRWSGRTGAFVAINCGSLPREIVESLLFGHRRGAFTGAFEDTRGLIEAAEGGTVFLDEVTAMPLEAQVKLLRTLDSGEVRRLGDTVPRLARFRVVSAVQPDAVGRVADGHLRLDLIQRLAGAVVELPDLAARGDDLLLLAEAFAGAHRRVLGPGVAEVLRGYGWPGNARELRFAVDRACLLGSDPVLPAGALAASIAMGAAVIAGRITSPPVPRAGAVPSPRDRLVAVYAANGFNAARTARALGVGRTTLFKRLKGLGVSLRAARASVLPGLVGGTAP